MNLLINEGKAKVLSKPRLLVVSGKEATFMVGGEVPIATTSTTGGGAGTTSSGTTFKTYGTTMSITPTIVDGKLVNIKLNVEISDIDRSVPSASGDVGYTTRSAHTQLVLENRQTIVLAGMIRRDKAKGVKRVPILSKIPLVGMLFRSETTPEQETELVISLTPTILLSEESRERLLAQEAAKKNAAGKTADDQLARKPAAVIPPKAPVPPVKAQVPTPPAAPKVPDPAPAPEPAGNEAADWDRSQIDVYARGIQAKIASAIAYPYEAQEKGWQGTVKLSLVIQKDGTLKAATVKETSGYEVFDQDAVNTAQILAPYEAFPSTAPAREITLNIPIVYSLDAFLSNVAKSE